MNRLIAQVPVAALKGSVLLTADLGRWIAKGSTVDSRVLRETIAGSNDEQRVSLVEAMVKRPEPRQSVTERLGDVGNALAVGGIGSLVVAVGANAFWHVPYEVTYSAYGLVIFATATHRGWPTKPIQSPNFQVSPIPQGNELVWQALMAIGVAGDKVAGTQPTIVESWAVGPFGSSCAIELGSQTTVGQVMAKHELLATALRVHPSRLSVITDDDRPSLIRLFAASRALRDMDTTSWPLPAKGSYFGTFPLGRMADGTPFEFTIAHRSVVIGGLPRYGKSYTLRAILTAVAQDPTVELVAADLKGTGDLNPLSSVGVVVRGSGPDELSQLLGLLRSVHGEIKRRADLMNADPDGLGDGSCQVSQAQGEAGIGLHPIVVAIDECHILFRSDVGADALKIVEDLVRRGPALGISVILATQSSKDNSIPADIADCADVKIAHRVAASKMETSLFGDGGDGTNRPQSLSDKDKGVAIVGIGGARTAIKVFGCDTHRCRELLDWRGDEGAIIRLVEASPNASEIADPQLAALMAYWREDGRQAVPLASVCQNIYGTTKPPAVQRKALETQLVSLGVKLQPKSSAICPITGTKKSGTVVRL